MRLLVIVPFLILLSFSLVALLPGATERLAEGKTAPFLILSVFMSSLLLLVSTSFMVSPGIFSISEKLENHEETQYPEEKCRALLRRLELRMEEGAFRNPDLSLPDLASEFGVNNNLLSHTVNCYSGMGFRSYLNRKRLDYFLEELERGENRSLLDMAFDAGFSSKSTFNRFFHEEKGMTPTEYLRRKENLIEN